MPHPKKLLSKLMAFDRLHGLTSPGDGILVAVSGGPDSVCLAHHLHRLAKTRRLRLGVLHVHHGLRGKEADADEAFVRAFAVSLGLPFHAVQAPVAKTAAAERRSIEDAARKLRYQAFSREAHRLRLKKVAVGHQLDDQAETLLLHLLRGTKAKGLAGIPPKRPLSEGITLIRPLLPLTRAEVASYLKAYALRHRLDRSNTEDRFTRNWVRRKVIPLLESRNPRIREHLAAVAEDVRKTLS